MRILFLFLTGPWELDGTFRIIFMLSFLYTYSMSTFRAEVYRYEISV